MPLPQAAFEWQATELQTPLPHVPIPQSAFDVQAALLHVEPPQVPPSQSSEPAQVQLPERHQRPTPQSASATQGAWAQEPSTAPLQAKAALGQSEPELQGSLHCPIAPGVAPEQSEV